VANSFLICLCWSASHRFRRCLDLGKTARITGRSTIFGSASVLGKAVIQDQARVGGTATVYGNAIIHDASQIWGGSVYGDAKIGGITWLVGSTQVYDNAIIASTNVERPIHDQALVHGTVQPLGDVEFSVEEISSGVWYGFIHPEFREMQHGVLIGPRQKTR